jgi:hypothetical protein
MLLSRDRPPWWALQVFDEARIRKALNLIEICPLEDNLV